MTVKIINPSQTKTEIAMLEAQGFTKNDIYIFSHHETPQKKQSIFELFKNLKISISDELRTKLKFLGLSKKEASQYEIELKKGELLLLACKR